MRAPMATANVQQASTTLLSLTRAAYGKPETTQALFSRLVLGTESAIHQACTSLTVISSHGKSMSCVLAAHNGGSRRRRKMTGRHSMSCCPASSLDWVYNEYGIHMCGSPTACAWIVRAADLNQGSSSHAGKLSQEQQTRCNSKQNAAALQRLDGVITPPPESPSQP